MPTVRIPIKFLLCCLIAAFSFSACEKEHIEELETTLIDGETYSVVEFPLTRSMVPTSFHQNEGDYPLELYLISKQTEEVSSHKTTFSYHNGEWNCKILVPQARPLADGEYVLLMVFSDDGTRYPFRLQLQFKDKMRVSEPATYEGEYKTLGLTGEGTENKPYLINDHNDLFRFHSAVEKDLLRGYGLYFQQKRSIDIDDYINAPNRLPEQGWVGIANGFCGVYDGNATTISQLTSRSTSNGIGLFSRLGDGAVIRDMILTDVSIETSAKQVGAIAGSATGNVTIESCTVSGNIQAGGQVGGFIGEAEGSLTIIDCSNKGYFSSTSGDLGGFVGCVHKDISVDGVTMGANLKSGGDHTGGIVGRVINGKVSFNDIDNTSQFQLKGTNHVGGVIGRLNGVLSLESVNIQRGATTSAAGYAIEGTGNVGGFIGSLSTTGNATISSNQLTLRIYGTENVGGIIGHVMCNNLLTIKETSTGTAGIVEGNTYVGGVIGKGEGTAKTTISFNEMNNEHSFQLPVKGHSNFAGGVVGSIANITFTNVLINANVTGNQRVGGFFGEANNVVIKNSNTTQLMKIDGQYAVGAIGGSTSNTQLPAGMVVSAMVNTTEEYKKAEQVGGIFGYGVNLDLVNITSNSTIYGSNKVGGFIGETVKKVKLDQCYNKSTVNGSGNNVGGIVGYSNCDELILSNSFNQGAVSGYESVGGLAGKVDGKTLTVNKCENSGTIKGKYRSVGGCVGFVSAPSNWEEVGNKGTVTNDNEYTGGITGFDYGKGVYYSCYNTGNISGKERVGGIIGTTSDSENFETNLRIKWCANSGKLTISDIRCGGLVGVVTGKFDIRESYNKGNLEGGKDSNVMGGIVGTVRSSSTNKKYGVYQHIENCCNLGNSSGKNDKCGGLVGMKLSDYPGNILNVECCYNAGKTHQGVVGIAQKNQNYSPWNSDYVFYLNSNAKDSHGTPCTEGQLKGNGTITVGKEKKTIYQYLGEYWRTGKEGYPLPLYAPDLN